MNLFAKYGRGRALLLAAAVVAIGAVCASNSDNPPALIGQWVSMSNGKRVELFKDGTGVIDKEDLKWKTEGKRFVLSYDGETVVCDYNLSGYELTRTFDDGKVIVWVRKDKVEEYKKKKIKEAEKRIAKISSYFTDSRNGQKYRAVTIGGKTWMAENLNFQTADSWCYDNSADSCAKYGRLYTWAAAKTACPTGWHLPSRNEWVALAKAAGGTGDYGDGDSAGKKLKSTYGWYNNGNGTDDFGFSALPAGARNPDGSFDVAGNLGLWWTVSGGAYSMYYEGVEVKGFEFGVSDIRGNGASVRCIQGEAANGTFIDSRDGKTYKTVKMPDGKTWMAENLNFNVEGSYCYDNRAGNCNKYGRLYGWEQAKNACPKGWHLPSRDEWTKLVTKVDSSTSGKKLKSTSGWYNNGNGTDEYDFSALPGGFRGYHHGIYGSFYAGHNGTWWTATEHSNGLAYFRSMNYDDDDVIDGPNDKEGGKAVRCVEG